MYTVIQGTYSSRRERRGLGLRSILGRSPPIMKVKRPLGKSAMTVREEISYDLQELAAKWHGEGMPGLGRMLQIVDAFYRIEKEGYLIPIVNTLFDLAEHAGFFEVLRKADKETPICEYCRRRSRGPRPNSGQENPLYVWFFDQAGIAPAGWFHKNCRQKVKRFGFIK